MDDNKGIKNNYKLTEEIPKADEYLKLRESVEWASPDSDSCNLGLSNSVYCVTIRDKGNLTGMGRVVGDGVFTFFIVDIIVHPDYQRKGLGKEIMKRIMDYLDKNAAENSYITLMAAKGREGFYKKFGFFTRPTDTYGCGMMLEFKK
jgi:GNAT superfamily N-acetyltransferase